MAIFLQILFRSFLPNEDVFFYMWIILILFVYNIYLVFSKDDVKSQSVLKFSLIIGVFGTLYGLVLTGDACAANVIPAAEILPYALGGFSVSLTPLVFHVLCWLVLSLIGLFVNKRKNV